jgi:predicted ferric reductase
MKKEGYVFIASIGSIFAAVITLFLINTQGAYNVLIRLFALLGLSAMFVASMITPFQKELYRFFKVPFVKIHHYLTYFGLTMITLHPVLFAIETAINGTAREGAAVFLPVFSSAYAFWSLAGRPALIIIYIAVIGALIRKGFKKGWRWMHALNYIALVFGVIHGIMSGSDFHSLNYSINLNIPGFIMTLMFLLMIAMTITTFTLKRIQLYKLKQRKTAKQEEKEEELKTEED